MSHDAENGKRMHTIRVFIFRTWYESTPECTSNFPLFQARQVDMHTHATILKGLLELVIINLILIQKRYRDCKIVVSIYEILEIEIDIILRR